MTVKELIDELAGFPMEMEVETMDSEYGYTGIGKVVMLECDSIVVISEC
jgi:hypothetical protein